ncbi:MAG: hypothetical protein P4L79_10370 [Legionella sp.]|uniref:hypothetical protein n=1 Tax=Legionella sp. TaxID=459 RepID=UPI0028475036|nr:hypothetical protein [Legionella sp.]
MTPYETYVDFMAIRTHLTSASYDYTKYKGKIGSASVPQYNKRRDMYWFEKLSKQQNPHDIIVSNILINPLVQPRDLCSETSIKNYKNWVRRTQNISNTLKKDIEALEPKFKDNFSVIENDQPHLLKMYLQDTITLETFTVLVNITRCTTDWNKKLKNDYVWQSLSLLVKKYPTFLNIDKKKIGEILKSHFVEESCNV